MYNVIDSARSCHYHAGMERPSVAASTQHQHIFPSCRRIFLAVEVVARMHPQQMYLVPLNPFGIPPPPPPQLSDTPIVGCSPSLTLVGDGLLDRRRTSNPYRGFSIVCILFQNRRGIVFCEYEWSHFLLGIGNV